jgi:MerC mercury resistance protein
MKTYLEKIGGIGSVVAAAACPVCFPKLALIGALFGLGALGAYESALFAAAQILVAVAVLGHALAYLRHRRLGLLVLGVGSGAAVFAGLYLLRSEAVVYAGFAGLVVASATDFWSRRAAKRGGPTAARPPLESVITCPKCHHRRREAMPTDACMFFYECTACGTLLRPKAGDCCVFCSYGSVKCPPAQTACAC